VRATGEVAYNILSLNNMVTHKLSGEEATGQTRKLMVWVICNLHVVKGLKLPNDKEDFHTIWDLILFLVKKTENVGTT